MFVMFGGLDITVLDKRDLSRFNSHIRYGLEICLAIFGCIFYGIKEKHIKKRTLWITIACWLIVFLFILDLFTGIVTLFISSVLMLVIYTFKTSNKVLRPSFALLTFLLITGGYYTVNLAIHEFYECENVTPIETIATTNMGEPYKQSNDSSPSHLKENGYLIYKHIAEKELELAWNKRSSISYFSNDLKGQQLKHTLIRFITSKGKRKDQQSVIQLTDEEVKAIEKGIANYKYIAMNGLTKRLHKIIWEYDRYVHGQDVNGHSVMMRWIYWKTAFRIFRKSPILGVGTGDVQDAFDDQYAIAKSKLMPKYRLRAHNQYITYAVSFGSVGLILFLFLLFYPIIVSRRYRNNFYLVFLSIVLLSMITEDTLETQVGITFFCIF